MVYQISFNIYFKILNDIKYFNYYRFEESILYAYIYIYIKLWFVKSVNNLFLLMTVSVKIFYHAFNSC